MELVMISLSPEEIEVLLTSLNYSKQRIRDGKDTPIEIKRENLSKIESVAIKLRSGQQ